MKMARSSLITALVSALLAGGFIYYSRPISSFIVSLFFTSKRRVGPEVAVATALTGHVQIRRTRQTEFAPLIEGAPVRHEDQIRVGENSDVILSFHSGHKIRIGAKSLVTVELYYPDEALASGVKFPALMTIREGDYELLEKGVIGQLFVNKDHQLFAAETKPKPISKTPVLSVESKPASVKSDRSDKSEIPTLGEFKNKNLEPFLAPDSEPKTSERSRPLDKIVTENGETLATPYIEDVLAEHSEDLRLCQLKSVRDNQNTDGHMLLSLTIQPTGHVDSVRFLRNELRNDPLSSCVQSVIERTKFKSFAGEPITITYPVEFR